MRRILLSLALLTIVAVGAQAQGAGLSQGQAYVAPTTTPAKAKKTCPDCGITKGNITYPWQHHTWCPYYRAQGGGSSVKKSGSTSTYTTASAATMAIGALLTGLISRPKTQAQTSNTTSSRVEAAKEREWREKQEAFGKWLKAYEARVERCSTSREYGDYKIVEVESEKSEDSYAQLCLYNQATGHYMLSPIDWKLKKKGKLALGTFSYKGKSSSHIESNMYFLNSSLLGNSPELDGLLVCEKGYVALTMGTGKTSLWNDVDAVYRLSGDSLVPVLYQGPSFIRKSKEEAEKLSKANAGYADFYHETENIPYRYRTFQPFGSLPYFLGIQTGENNYNHYALYNQEGKVIVKNSGVEIQRCGSIIYAGSGKTFDLYMNPVFGEYEYHFAPMQMIGVGWYFPVSKEKKCGLINERGEVIIPCIYSSDRDIKNLFNKLTELSYTKFYKNEAAKHIDKKGEYEKTEHFEARMKDAKMQEEYLREIMVDAPERYLEEKVWEKGELQLTIGEYNADEECFPIAVEVAPWNSIMLPIPMAEAKAFKKEFNSIKAAAAKTAQLGIRYDAPSVESITFTTSDGKTYRYEN